MVAGLHAFDRAPAIGNGSVFPVRLSITLQHSLAHRRLVIFGNQLPKLNQNWCHLRLIECKRFVVQWSLPKDLGLISIQRVQGAPQEWQPVRAIRLGRP